MNNNCNPLDIPTVDTVSVCMCTCTIRNVPSEDSLLLCIRHKTINLYIFNYTADTGCSLAFLNPR